MLDIILATITITGFLIGITFAIWTPQHIRRPRENPEIDTLKIKIRKFKAAIKLGESNHDIHRNRLHSVLHDKLDSDFIASFQE